MTAINSGLQALVAGANAAPLKVNVTPLPEARARFWERLRLDGEKVDGNVTGRLLSASMIRAYDSATSLELVLDDHDYLILRSGLISKKGKVGNRAFDQAAWARFGDTRLVLDGIAFRLVGVNGDASGEQGHQITLTFEDELAVLMRRKKGPKRWTRGDWHKGLDTRATVIWNMVTEALGNGSRFMTPQLFDRQPVRGESDKAQKKARTKGLAHWRRVKVQGFGIDEGQKREIETSLRVADEEQAGDRATIAMLCAGIGESGFRAIMNTQGSPYGGVFQGNVRGGVWDLHDTAGMARSFLRGGKGFQGGGAIALAAAHPDWGPGLIAVTVEGSRANFSTDAQAEGHYGQYATEAQNILDAWGGVGQIKVVTHRYAFTVAKGENYFDAAGRLAQEVNWRFWIDSNQIWYAPDEWLFTSATTLEVSPTTIGVRGFTYTVDVGIKIGELTFTANIPRWVGSPAWRTEVDDMGPFNGLWLVARHEQDLITEDSTVILRRPAPELKEPAPTREKVTLSETAPDKGSTRQKILKVCERAYANRGKYHYLQTRPMPGSLFSAGPKYIDCSSFATLVYKAAGAPDPNGVGYNGSGYTGTLAAYGRKTNDPQPGDLCLFGAAPGYAHVNVYAGGGKSYNMGPSAGLSFGPTMVRGDFAGYWTYDLGG